MEYPFTFKLIKVNMAHSKITLLFEDEIIYLESFSMQ